MSSPPKSVLARAETARTGRLYRIAIVGASSLKGKEVAEVLNDRNFPSLDTRLLDDDESLGQLETVGDEISFIQSVRAEQFENVDFTFFASDQDCARKTWKLARDAGSAIVDLSAALEDEPGAVVRSTWVERQLGQSPVPELQPGPVVTAHPAAIVVALVLLRAQTAGRIRQVVATVFEPASEHGQKGMDELHEQTVNLLSFQPLPKAIFDAQVAFNMLSRYGERSVPSLASVESRLLKHYRRICGGLAPAPTLLLIQAPTFHGHAFALHLEMEEAVNVSALSQALASEHLAVVPGGEEAPNNVNAAGQGDIRVSVIADPTRSTGVWVWAAADNLRIAALAAVECAESMTPSRAKGQIQ